MTPSEYVLSTLTEYPDNEMTARDLQEWQPESAGDRFDMVAIYNALAYLYAKRLVVKRREGGSTWWALRRQGDVVVEAGEKAETPSSGTKAARPPKRRAPKGG